MLRVFRLLLFFGVCTVFAFYLFGFVVNEEFFVFLAFFCFLEFFGKITLSAVNRFLDQRTERIYLNIFATQELQLKSLVFTLYYYTRILDVRKVTKDLTRSIYLELSALTSVFDLDAFYFKSHADFYMCNVLMTLQLYVLRAVVSTSFFANFSIFIRNLLVVYSTADISVAQIPLLQVVEDSIFE